jgi:hypothetical protein
MYVPESMYLCAQGMAPLNELSASRAECRSLNDRVCRMEDDLRRADQNLMLSREEAAAALLAVEKFRREAASARAEVEDAQTEARAASGRCSDKENTIKKMQASSRRLVKTNMHCWLVGFNPDDVLLCSSWHGLAQAGRDRINAIENQCEHQSVKASLYLNI